jgi:hypothetical protein
MATPIDSNRLFIEGGSRRRWCHLTQPLEPFERGDMQPFQQQQQKKPRTMKKMTKSTLDISVLIQAMASRTRPFGHTRPYGRSHVDGIEIYIGKSEHQVPIFSSTRTNGSSHIRRRMPLCFLGTRTLLAGTSFKSFPFWGLDSCWIRLN